MADRNFDPAKRIREKQEAREQDERDLTEGKVTAVELQRRNSLFGSVDLTTAKLRIRNPMR